MNMLETWNFKCVSNDQLSFPQKSSIECPKLLAAEYCILTNHFVMKQRVRIESDYYSCSSYYF